MWWFQTIAGTIAGLLVGVVFIVLNALWWFPLAEGIFDKQTMDDYACVIMPMPCVLAFVELLLLEKLCKFIGERQKKESLLSDSAAEFELSLDK